MFHRSSGELEPPRQSIVLKDKKCLKKRGQHPFLIMAGSRPIDQNWGSYLIRPILFLPGQRTYRANSPGQCSGFGQLSGTRRIQFWKITGVPENERRRDGHVDGGPIWVFFEIWVVRRGGGGCMPKRNKKLYSNVNNNHHAARCQEGSQEFLRSPRPFLFLSLNPGIVQQRESLSLNLGPSSVSVNLN